MASYWARSLALSAWASFSSKLLISSTVAFLEAFLSSFLILSSFCSHKTRALRAWSTCFSPSRIRSKWCLKAFRCSTKSLCTSVQKVFSSANWDITSWITRFSSA
uniref:Putative secreted protein n=1 Tax=Ixodes ricinus TaxID=34613 RepID=A0A6B0UD76_IXORI